MPKVCSIPTVAAYCVYPCCQSSDIGQAVHGVSGETADLLGENQIEPAVLAAPDHLQKAFSLGNAVVGGIDTVDHLRILI